MFLKISPNSEQNTYAGKSEAVQGSMEKMLKVDFFVLARRGSIKKESFKTLQNYPENNCAGVSF